MVAMVPGYGIIAFRDVHGIRPLILGQRETEHGTDYIFASESVVLDVLGYKVMGDVAPGTWLRRYTSGGGMGGGLQE